MKVLILSGVGGSSNWLPLMFPLAAIVLVIYAIDVIVRYIKKRRQHDQEKPVNDLATPIDSSDTTII